MAQAYAAGLVAQRCVDDAGTLDQGAMRQAAAALNMTTFYGGFRIDPTTGRQVGRQVGTKPSDCSAECGARQGVH